MRVNSTTQIEYKLFAKPESSSKVVQEDSAIPKNTKVNALVNECER